MKTIIIDIKRTICDYDGPKIFEAVNLKSKELYLVFVKDDYIKSWDHVKSSYFMVETTEDNIKKLESRSIDIRSWLESHSVFIDYDIVYKNLALPEEKFEETSLHNLINEGVIPEKGVFL